MSTYAVFGMTDVKAKELATKHVSRAAVKKKRYIEERVFHRWVAGKAYEILKGHQIVCLTDKFDAPQYAQHWIDLARKTTKCRHLHIKAQTKKEDKTMKRGYKLVWESIRV